MGRALDDRTNTFKRLCQQGRLLTHRAVTGRSQSKTSPNLQSAAACQFLRRVRKESEATGCLLLEASYHIAFLGFGIHSHKVGYPKKGAWYEPTGASQEASFAPSVLPARPLRVPAMARAACDDPATRPEGMCEQ